MENKNKKIPDFILNLQVLNGDNLKFFALFTMLIDHIGAGILRYFFSYGYYPPGMDFDKASAFYEWFRHVGRWAFPIYCFFIVEGLIHTRSVPKYAIKLGIFGIFSEPCFDLAFRLKTDVFSSDIPQVLIQNSESVMEKCNVYFTLLIGLLVIWTMKYVEDNLFVDNPLSPIGKSPDNPLYLILYFAPVIAGGLLAQLLQTDYRFWGVILITIFYVFRNNRIFACIAGYMFLMNMSSEAWSLPAFTLIAFFYNGERGKLPRQVRFWFYAFYPIHLLLLYLLRCQIYSVISA
ncbi:TraX family protein [Butyrivibrio sp. AE3004]|uniref:TraX family protein n=1 Tax=Butyrivibrio sp. AE3004 TaxID=1506994 RepID=UPI0018CBFD2C|nr:TraX family protein [Butyrivibrio sp. AE3004]